VTPALTGVAVTGRSPLSPQVAAGVVRAVLSWERRRGLVSVAFVGRDRMRGLQARFKGRSRSTDVLAFALAGPGRQLVGDIYVCPWVAARQARRFRIPVREELIRLLVHGTLHVLGWDHPEGDGRTRSPMWRRQERYVGRLA
jgi:probable rRNA maturation factor